VEINFKKKVNFWELANFSKSKNFDSRNLLKIAFEQNALSDDSSELLKKFIQCFNYNQKFNSQLYQDIFANFIISNKYNKTFLEFGATDGINISNSYTLETFYEWKGVLSEPSIQWHELLKKNRKNTEIITKCIWSHSDKIIDFYMSENGVLSTINEFVESDKYSIPANTIERKKGGKIIPVETISLNDVIIKYFNCIEPSYISIDTEGSEFEILKTFDFNKFRPKVFTIEHNFAMQNQIDYLMSLNNYERVFKDLTAFDAWYVSSETLEEIV